VAVNRKSSSRGSKHFAAHSSDWLQSFAISHSGLISCAVFQAGKAGKALSGESKGRPSLARRLVATGRRGGSGLRLPSVRRECRAGCLWAAKRTTARSVESLTGLGRGTSSGPRMWLRQALTEQKRRRRHYPQRRQLAKPRPSHRRPARASLAYQRSGPSAIRAWCPKTPFAPRN
jgi:hypothetical protein